MPKIDLQRFNWTPLWLFWVVVVLVRSAPLLSMPQQTRPSANVFRDNGLCPVDTEDPFLSPGAAH